MNLSNHLNQLKSDYLSMLNQEYQAINEVGKNLLQSCLAKVETWQLAHDTEKFDIVPNIPINLKPKNYKKIPQDFVSLADNAKSNHTSNGYQNQQILIAIPPLPKQYSNNVFCYQYHSDTSNPQSTIIDRVNVSCRNIEITTNPTTSLHLADDTEIQINALRRVFWQDSDHLVVLTVGGNYQDKMLTVDGKFKTVSLPELYLTSYLYKFKSNQVVRTDYDMDFNPKHQSNYDVQVMDRGDYLIKIDDVQVYPVEYNFADEEALFQKVFDNLSPEDVDSLNKKQAVAEILQKGMAQLEFDEVEALLEAKWATHEFEEVEYQGLMAFFDKFLNIQFINADEVCEFLKILENEAHEFM